MAQTSKTQQMLDLLNAGKTKEALAIAKTFRIGFTKEQQKVLGVGYECLVHPAMYKQLGKDCEACVEAAVQLLKDTYAQEKA